MNIYEIPSAHQILRGNRYPGRGIIIGKTPDGENAAVCYFIMGRSANSRNRIFAQEGDCVYTRTFDISKVEDPSLIIYAALRSFENQLIVTNGDQTDTVYDALSAGKSFEDALAQREFEPDAPNFTPRISGLLTFENGDFSYKMSILKSGDPEGCFCNRFFYYYTAQPGLGHFLHTYDCDGSPIPPFQGEPERIAIDDNIDSMTENLWQSLDSENKISLYVRYVNLKSGEITNRMKNKNN